MAQEPRKLLTITVKLDTWSAKDALRDAQKVADNLDTLLPKGAVLKGVNVR